MAINKTLFRRVRNYLLAEPLRYQQVTWIRRNDRLAPCGTASCVGGTTQILLVKDGVVDDEDFGYLEAGAALGLTEEQADILFSAVPGASWPQPFRSRWTASHEIYTESGRRRAQARIVADFINHIIKTGKVEQALKLVAPRIRQYERLESVRHNLNSYFVLRRKEKEGCQ